VPSRFKSDLLMLPCV